MKSRSRLNGKRSSLLFFHFNGLPACAQPEKPGREEAIMSKGDSGAFSPSLRHFRGSPFSLGCLKVSVPALILSPKSCIALKSHISMSTPRCADPLGRRDGQKPSALH